MIWKKRKTKLFKGLGTQEYIDQSVAISANIKLEALNNAHDDIVEDV